MHLTREKEESVCSHPTTPTEPPSKSPGLAFLLSLYPAFKPWLQTCYFCLGNSGFALVNAISDPDNVASAEKLLLAAELEGWIKRAKISPSREQIFFGVGGSSFKVAARSHRLSATLHFWEPTGSKAALHWLRS